MSDLEPGAPERLSFVDVLLGNVPDGTSIEEFDELLSAARARGDMEMVERVARFALEQHPEHVPALRAVSGDVPTASTFTLVEVVPTTGTIVLLERAAADSRARLLI